MNKPSSLLDELRVRYEAVHESPDDRRSDVESLQAIDARNVDRLENVILELPSTAIGEPVLEDLVRLVLGSDSAFLKRGRLAGLRGQAPG